MSELPPVEVNFDPRALLARAIEEGLSANKALQTFREAGLGMRRETFLNLYGEMRAAIGNRDLLASIDYGVIPDEARFTPWSAGTPGTYVYGVQLGIRDVGDVIPRTSYFWVDSDVRISPGDALDIAIGRANDLSGNTDTFGKVVVLGGVVSSLNRMTGKP